MQIKILTNRNNYLEEIEAVKTEWVEEVLEAIGINLLELHALDQIRQPEFLIEKYKVDIVTYPGVGALRIDCDNDTIAEWAGPNFLLKTDKETKEKYYEITIEAWTFMDEEINMK